MDASYIIYTGVPTTNIPITPGQNLQTILQNIDVAIANSSAAPNYSGYSLGCVRTQVGTINTTQQFAEGISGLFCTLQSNYTTFTGTTYPAAISTLTTAVNGLQYPSLTYSPFSITSADSVTTVWSKVFTGITAINTAANPSSASWSTLSISPSPTTVTTAFSDIITYLSSLTSIVNGKQASLGTFDNSTNCLSGTNADSAGTTIGLLSTYICTLPTFSTSGYTWGCLSTQTTLSNTIGEIITAINTVNKDYVSGVSTGLTLTSVACGGRTVAVDTTWTGLYKTMLSSDTYSNADYLDNKVSSNAGTVTITNYGNKVNFEVTNPTNNKVLVQSGGTPDYLDNKVVSTLSPWGLNLSVGVVGDQLVLSPNVANPTVFISNLLSYISANPAMLAQWCQLLGQCNGTTCSSPTSLAVSISTGAYVLTWTVGGTPISQTAQYMQRGSPSGWITNVNITPANPLSSSATTTTINGLANNIVYQFQVESVCASGVGASSIFESIIFQAQTLSKTVTGSSPTATLAVSQAQLPTVDTVQYQLWLNGSVIASATATGANPVATFTGLSSGSYTIKWRYGATVNGTTLYSDASTQLNAWCSTTQTI